MAHYGSAADSRKNRFEIVAQAWLVTRELTKVSEKVGIPRRTLTRIVADPEFQAIFKAMKLKLMDDALLKLRNAADAAVDTMIALMKDEYVAPAVRLAAASRILEFGDAADVKERFQGRLDQLEAKTVEAVVIAGTDNWIDGNGSDNQTDYEVGESRTVAA